MSTRAFKTLFGLGPWRKGPALVRAIRDKGVDAFNRTRSRHPHWAPDFSGAALRDLDLTLANVRYANMVGAELDGVILDGLELSGERAKNTLARRGAVVE